MQVVDDCTVTTERWVAHVDMPSVEHFRFGLGKMQNGKKIK